MRSMRVTRSSEKKRRLDEGLPPTDQPKPKSMTLGKYLATLREEEEEELLECEALSKYEQFADYDKEVILADLGATEFNPKIFHDNSFYVSADNKDAKVLFLTLETGAHPREFTHLCNNSCLKWNLQRYHISHSAFHMSIPSVIMVFVRGEHVEGTSLSSSTYKYLGMLGLQSMSSGSVAGGGGKHEYLCATLVFDCVVSRKELGMFGANVMRCKKNKYGCSLCS